MWPLLEIAPACDLDIESMGYVAHPRLELLDDYHIYFIFLYLSPSLTDVWR